DGGRFNWLARAEGDAFPPAYLPGNWTKAYYRQVTAPTPERGVSPAMSADPSLVEHLTIITGLPQIREYFKSLMQELVVKERLPKYSDWAPGEPLPANHHEQVARAIDEHLRTSGQFEYSMTLKRFDTNIDPIEDFLLNGRSGHCNRFASALALL